MNVRKTDTDTQRHAPHPAQIAQERRRMETLMLSSDPKAVAYAEAWFRRYGRDGKRKVDALEYTRRADDE